MEDRARQLDDKINQGAAGGSAKKGKRLQV